MLKHTVCGLIHAPPAGPTHAQHLCPPGDKIVDWNDSFRLYLVSRSPTALSELPPDVAPLLTITNFAITRSSLEGEARYIPVVTTCRSWVCVCVLFKYGHRLFH